MLNEIRLDVGIENPPEITPGRYSSLIFRIRRVFEGNNREKFLCGSRLGKKASYAPIWHFKLLRWVKSNKRHGREGGKHCTDDLYDITEENIKLTFVKQILKSK